MSTPRPLRSRYGGEHYDIRYVPSASLKTAAGGGPADGITRFAEKRIEIVKSISPADQRETLLHELLHQLLDYHADAPFPRPLEESIVTHLGLALREHIDLNPTFWRYVTRRTP